MSGYNERRAAAAWDRFRAAVAAQGGTVLEGAWKGAHTAHSVRCANGHDCTPKPVHVNQGGGICRVCVGQSSEAAWDAFQATVGYLGGTVLEGAWKGAQTPHRVRCANGHEATVRPDNVRTGQGLCTRCVGKIWDAFYVVHDAATATVKFGITSGDPKARLYDHRRNGFTTELRVFTGLAEGEAKRLEDELKLQMRCAGVRPVRGTEYFPDAVLMTLLPFVDGWMKGSQS